MVNSCETILICPLNWGLGHATRDIPIIKRFIEKGFRVIVATEAPIIQLLHKEIPTIETEYFPGPKISYSSGNKQIWKLFKQLPIALFWLIREKQITARLVKKHNPVCVISDNRYGVRHKKVKSIIITHQLMLKMPPGSIWLEKLFHLLAKTLISRFSFCWIPDNPPPNSLAGDLVHQYKKPKNGVLIGPLSRFMEKPVKQSDQEHKPCSKAELLILLSGPEPQRTILQNILVKKITEEKITTIMVTGKPGSNKDTSINNEWIEQYTHLETGKLLNLIEKTPNIICRSGYSSIMDLWFLDRFAVLVPTPGQTEQEYLAEFHNKRSHIMIQQNKLIKQSLRDLFLIHSDTIRNNTNNFNPYKLLDLAIELI